MAQVEGPVFEDPPAATRGPGAKGRVNELVAPLRRRPGEWARVFGPATAKQATNWAQRLKLGRCYDVNEGEFEAIRRTVDGESFVWARYVGNGDGESWGIS